MAKLSTNEAIVKQHLRSFFLQRKHSCMKLTTVHVLKNNFVMIYCAFCGVKKRVLADK